MDTCTGAKTQVLLQCSPCTRTCSVACADAGFACERTRREGGHQEVLALPSCLARTTHPNLKWGTAIIATSLPDISWPLCLVRVPLSFLAHECRMRQSSTHVRLLR
mmetsp:Transcript_8786/g.23636  ORF Transcript_8786/g.23636 Transcript_8786/m.23636 type:complete len:106 (-) Transcript_8786:1098-1415(-)